MDMKRYAVFTRISTRTGEINEVFVMNVKAYSAGGAEHVLLDGYRAIDNALAFDMETEMQQAAPYFSRAKVLDLADFDRRERDRECRIQEYIDDELDYIDELKANVANLKSEIAHLKNEIAYREMQIATTNADIKEFREMLESTCRVLHIQPVHSEETVQGIA